MIAVCVQRDQEKGERRTMDDLVSRQTAIDAIKTIRREIWGVDIPNPGNCPEYVEHHEQMKKLMLACDNLIKEIEKQTTAERNNGRWIMKEKVYGGLNGDSTYRYECSKCGFSDEHNSSREVPFCWHCGARMEAE